MKALRLPTRVSAVAYGFASAGHPILLPSCPPQRSWKVGGPFQARALGWPAARPAGVSRVVATGFSQVFRRSFLCLCSAPGPRSNRRVLAAVGHVDAAPRWVDGEGFGNVISGLTRSFGTRCPTLHAGVAAHVQGLLPAGRLAFAGRESNPLNRDERFQLVLTIIPLSCSPDATTLRFGLGRASCGVERSCPGAKNRQGTKSRGAVPWNYRRDWFRSGTNVALSG